MIAVDDGSTDGSYELMESMDIPNLKIYRNPGNRGVNYTRNRGIENATGEYILFLDSDDKLFPHGLDTVFKYVTEHAAVRHFLFFVSSNQNTGVKMPYTTTYREWLTERVFGDFTHVIRRSILLQYPFFEQFRAYENLNWQRIIKATEPQLVVPETITWVDMERSDNLTKTLRLKTTEAIEGKFNYLKFYLGLYGNDLYGFDPAMYLNKFRHALMLGVAAYKKNEARELIEQSPLMQKGKYRLFVSLFPSLALNKAIRAK